MTTMDQYVAAPRSGLGAHGLVMATLALVGLALLSACGSSATSERRPAPPPGRIGVIVPDFNQPSLLRDAFEQGLRDHGYVEGQNVVVEYRFTDRKSERFAELAAELVALPVDVIVVFGGTPDIQAVKAVTTTVPVVFAAAGDPVRSGLVASLARPGGNATGVTNIALELSPKRLDLLKQTVPGLARVAVLWNPTNPAKEFDYRDTQDA